MASSHSGHGVKKTNWPLWKRLVGYLNRSSNMKSTSRKHRDKYRDVLGATGSYRQSRSAGKLNIGAHVREALVSEKDSMWQERQNSEAVEDFVEGQLDLASRDGSGFDLHQTAVLVGKRRLPSWIEQPDIRDSEVLVF